MSDCAFEPSGWCTTHRCHCTVDRQPFNDYVGAYLAGLHALDAATQAVDSTWVMSCSIDECQSPDYAARGMCWKHYRRWLRHGDPRHATQSIR